MTEPRHPTERQGASDPRQELRDPHLDALWRALPAEEPPAAMGAALKAAARREVGAGPQRVTPHVAEATRPERWWWPLAAAATIGAIAIGVLQLAPDERSERGMVSDMPRAPAASSDSKRKLASEPEQMNRAAQHADAVKRAPVGQSPQPTTSMAAPSPPARPDATAGAPTARADDAKRVPTQRSEARSAPGPQLEAARRGPTLQSEAMPTAPAPRDDEAYRAQVSHLDATKRTLGQPSAADKPAPAASIDTRERRGAELKDAPAMEPTLRQERAREMQPPRAAAAAGSPTAPAPIEGERSNAVGGAVGKFSALEPPAPTAPHASAPQAFPSLGSSASLSHGAKPQREGDIAAAQASATSKTSAAAREEIAKERMANERIAKERDTRTVAEWIALIRRLRDEGATEQALRELTAFRERHADAEVLLPPDLRDWRAPAPAR